MGFTRYLIVLAILLNSKAVLSSIWGCNSDDECSWRVGSVCRGGECLCGPGTQTVMGGTRCAAVAPYYHSPCFDDYQCSRLLFNYQCTRAADAASNEAGVCECQPNFHYMGGRCWPSNDLGESCTVNEDCMGRLRDPFSMSCEQGTCVCSPGYYLRQRGECRRSGLAVDDACVIDEDCQFPRGECQSFRCVEHEGPELEPELEPESKAAPEPEPKPEQESKAELKPEPSRTNQSALRLHGQPCVDDCGETFECTSQGTCACPRGYYANADGTACLANLGSPVSDSSQCVGFFTEVRDGICTCQSNFYYDDDMRSCVKVATSLNDFCSSDLSCTTFGVFTRCGPPQDPWGLRTCQCIPEETVWNANRNMCMLFAGVGEQCEVDSDCLAGELEINCVKNDEGQGICSCPDEYVAIDGLCLMLGQELGDTCQVTTECTGTENTVCTGGVCVCANGFQASGDQCLPAIGGTCTVDANCAIDNTICAPDTNTCQCGAQFVEYNDVCFEVVEGFGDQCEVTAQCAQAMGPGGACVNGNCTCGSDYHYRDEQCWLKTGLFETCSRSSQCFLGDITDRVQCRNSLCQCAFEYPYSDILKTCLNSAARGTVNIVLLLGVLYLHLS